MINVTFETIKLKICQLSAQTFVDQLSENHNLDQGPL